MDARRQRNWRAGDLFLVPQADGGHTVAQVITHELMAMNSALCAFTLRRASPQDPVGPIRNDEVVSIQFVTVELLDSGEWPTAGNTRPVVPASALDIERKRATHFAGTSVCGSGVISSFLNACFGLEAWDDWVDPQMLDKLLVDPAMKPALVVYKNERPVN